MSDPRQTTAVPQPPPLFSGSDQPSPPAAVPPIAAPPTAATPTVAPTPSASPTLGGAPMQAAGPVAQLAVGQAQGRAAGRFHIDPACPHCLASVDRRHRALGSESCQACGRPFEAVFFDPPPIPSYIPRLTQAGPDGGHPCAVHGDNLAITHCSRCGVFMCSLCRVEIEDLEICPACYQRQRQAGELIPLRLQYSDFEHYAFVLGILAIFPFTFFGFFLGPLAIYLAGKGLHQAEELGHTSGRWWLQAARVLGLLGTLASLGIITSLIVGAVSS